MSYRATPCPCGHRACKDWHVTGVADVQGVGFTEAQARAVAATLNLIDERTSRGWKPEQIVTALEELL